MFLFLKKALWVCTGFGFLGLWSLPQRVNDVDKYGYYEVAFRPFPLFPEKMFLKCLKLASKLSVEKDNPELDLCKKLLGNRYSLERDFNLLEFDLSPKEVLDEYKISAREFPFVKTGMDGESVSEFKKFTSNLLVQVHVNDRTQRMKDYRESVSRELAVKAVEVLLDQERKKITKAPFDVCPNCNEELSLNEFRQGECETCDMDLDAYLFDAQGMIEHFQKTGKTKVMRAA